MWAYELSGPGRLVRVEVDDLDGEALAPGQVLVRFRAGGICGSDVPSYLGRRNPLVAAHGLPGYPLHEVVGDVVATREADFAVGERIVGWADGMRGLAEYFVARADSVLTVPAHLGSSSATVIQPLATVLHALSRVDPIARRRVAIIGQGSTGMLFSHALKTLGAAHVIGVDRVDRRDVAEDFGVDEMVWADSAQWAASLHADGRPALVIEAVGHQVRTLNDALAALAPHGTVLAFGVPSDPYYPLAFEALFRKGTTLVAGVTRDRRRALQQARDYLNRHPALLDAFVTHVLPVREAQRAFELAAAPTPGQLKVVLDGGM